MIPEEKKTAVQHALQQAFGVTDFEDIRMLTTGLSSALIYRVVILGKPYLLRVITSTEAVADPSHWYGSMKTAAEAGLAPNVWYAGVDDRIAITDFIEAKPFPPSEALLKMPAVLKRLHTLPSFPVRVNFMDAVAGFAQKFQAAGILPEEITADLFANYEKIKNIYPRNSSDQVGCHNDLKPENILYDGKRVWLVDWEAAFINDRYIDLSIAANFIVKNEAEEIEYLKIYFGRKPTEYQLARFFLARQILHVSYFTLFMLIVHRAGITIDPKSAIPDFRQFNDQMWAGMIDLADIDAKQQYAWVHMEQLRHNFGLKRFEDSLRIVSEYQD